MRVNWPRLDRVRDEERGAVAFIVAISLIAVLGMVVLVFDLGRSVAIRRDMVNASDSAVLAAAQKCADPQYTGLDRLGSAQADASTLVGENATGATVTAFSADECDNDSVITSGLKHVDLESTIDFQYFFAEIFGLNSGDVKTGAEAAWGPTQTAFGAAPIRIPITALAPCETQLGIDDNPNCAFSFDNDPTKSQWGFMNFPDGWPEDGVGPPADCPNNGGAADIRAYLSGTGTPFEAQVPSPEGYVWVCAGPGMDASAIEYIQNLIENAGPDGLILTFPVMAGAPDNVLQINGSQQALKIIGFTVLQVTGAWHGNAPWNGSTADDHCTYPPGTPGGSKFCIQTKWNGGGIIPGLPGDTEFRGANSVRLVK